MVRELCATCLAGHDLDKCVKDAHVFCCKHSFLHIDLRQRITSILCVYNVDCEMVIYL